MGLVGYFTAEIGLWSELHTYSGGLGVLAGDHVKSAADAEIDLVGVTLLYREGYGRQHIDDQGNQTESFGAIDPADHLIDTGLDITLPLDGGTLHAKIWKVEVVGVTGHVVPVYFMDTHHPKNSDYHQSMGARLYGGNDDVRIRQEYLLGVGGVRLLNMLRKEFTGLHLNEGHCTFALLELLHQGWTREELSKKILFTTHTPVPAGHDRFDWADVNEVLGDLMPDDVIGVSGTFSQNGDMFYVDDLHFPMQSSHDKKFAEQGVSVAFLSDIHVGSKTFLEAQWHKMVQWFNTDPLARTIKYLILSGDCVDGVGIYPGQDKELSIKDLYGQYTRFAELLELLPDWVECIMLPGNHDAVRPAEPQPTLEPDIQQDFNTTTFVGNPCDFSLDGVRLLSYHGKSIDDFVAGLRTVTYRDPVEAMRQMLRRRHLAPQWGGKTPLSPEPEDGLVIREVPDIFVTGHVHGHACIDFRGTTLVCSSTWQDQTSYQRMLGFQPKPCMLTVVNLGTHKSISIPFA